MKDEFQKLILYLVLICKLIIENLEYLYLRSI